MYYVSRGGLQGLGLEEGVRPSCMECVEKHLGSACVLCGELADGYPYRHRVIGHLHEAEDESRQWPALHRAIREARKRFQRDGVTPDWQRLQGLCRLCEGA